MKRYRDPGLVTGARRTTADMVEAAAASSEKADRLLSISRFSALTGFDRGTVRGWLAKGCPSESSGGSGEATLLDVRAVWKSREEQVRAEEAARFAAPSRSTQPMMGGVPLKPADILKLEQIKLTRMKIARDAEMTLDRTFAEYAVERMFGIVRQASMAIVERLFRNMAGFPVEHQVLNRIWRAFVTAAWTSGRWSPPPGAFEADIMEVEWEWPVTAQATLTQEIASVVKLVELGVMPPSYIPSAYFGMRHEDVVRQSAKDYARARENGLLVGAEAWDPAATATATSIGAEAEREEQAEREAVDAAAKDSLRLPAA